MKFKKLLVLLLTLALMTTSFAACGGQEAEAPAEPPAVEEPEVNVVEE